MEYNAIYREDEIDGRTVHAIDFDGGGFVVSSREVGVAVQNFLHFASLEDLAILHGHLLREYARRWNKTDNLSPAQIIQIEKDREAMRRRGETDGKNAVEWMLQGQLVTDHATTYLDWLVKGMDDGDPAIMNELPEPRLGGEFADDPNWEQVCLEEIDRYDDDGEEEMFAIYTEAFHEAVEAEIRRVHAIHNSDDHSKKV